MNRAADRQERRAHDTRLRRPAAVPVAADSHLYVTADQLHRRAKHQRGEDERREPRTLFRIRVGVRRVLLR